MFTAKGKHVLLFIKGPLMRFVKTLRAINTSHNCGVPTLIYRFSEFYKPSLMFYSTLKVGISLLAPLKSVSIKKEDMWIRTSNLDNDGFK